MMYNVEKRSECLVISFLEISERNDFVNELEKYEWEDGYITTKTFFNILANVDISPPYNPYKEDLLVWNKKDIEGQINMYIDRSNKFQYIVEFPHPHPLIMGVKEHEETIITENGLLIIRSDFFLKKERYNEIYRELLDEMKNGLVVLPPHLHAEYIPAGTAVKMKNEEEE